MVSKLASASAAASRASVYHGYATLSVPALLIFKLGRPMNTSNLLGEVSTSADKVARKVLINDCFGSEELRV
jgi:hypothetical protein